MKMCREREQKFQVEMFCERESKGLSSSRLAESERGTSFTLWMMFRLSLSEDEASEAKVRRRKESEVSLPLVSPSEMHEPILYYPLLPKVALY